MGNEKLFTMRCSAAEYSKLEKRAKGAGLSMADFVRVRTGLANDTGFATDAAVTCDNETHLLAMSLLPHVAEVSRLMSLIRNEGKTRNEGGGASGGQPGLSTGPNTMQGEGEAARHLPGGAADSAPARELADLLPSDRPSMRGSSLAGLVDAVRLPRKGRK